MGNYRFIVFFLKGVISILLIFVLLHLLEIIDINLILRLRFFITIIFLVSFFLFHIFFEKNKGKRKSFEIFFTLFFFIGLLGILLGELNIEFFKNIQYYFTIITVFCAFFIFFFNSKKIDSKKPKLDEKNLNRIDVISIVICISCFLIFGIHHLGQFMSVDEPKWIDHRVPQLHESLKIMDWGGTYINDKPGLLPSLLSIPVFLFLNYDHYRFNSLEFENFLFYWRLPILLFNAFLLLPIYFFTKKLLNKTQALIILILISFNPVLLGISQIVNPDSVLWSIMFLTFLSFMLYIKEKNPKYIYYTGLFFGLGLITKYFISIFYLVFFLIIYLEYLFKYVSREEFFQRCLDFMFMVIISILVYFLLFPVNWVRPEQIFEGSINSGLLQVGKTYIVFLVFVVFFELFILKGKLTNYLRNRFNLQRIFLYFFSILSSLVFVFLMINLFLNDVIFNPNEYALVGYQRWNTNIVGDTFYSLYTVLLSQTFFMVLGFFFFILLLILKKKFKKFNEFLIVIIFLTTFLLISSSTIGGFVLNARYQIFMYPFYAILASFFIIKIFPLLKYRWILLLIIIFISFLTLNSSKPFYFHYTNSLNFNNYFITDAWGFGGYEVAQVANQLPNAKNISVWVDRQGFSEFFVGNIYWRDDFNPFDEDIDYLVLTSRGKAIFTNALEDYETIKGYTAQNTNLLEYYDRDGIYEIHINDNPNNFVKLVKFK